MKHKFLKTVLSLVLIVGFTITSQAQEHVKENANTPQTEVLQKNCNQIISSLVKYIEYPKEAYFNDYEGKVIVKFHTDQNNKISDISIVDTTDEVFVKSVLDAIENMALKDDLSYLTANTTYNIPINFELSE